jgi:hypothetical protein
MTEFEFIMFAMATWYLSYIITAQNGPFSILEMLRERTHQRMGGLLSCIYCVAPYIAGLVYVVSRNAEIGYPLVRVLAIAGFALMLRSYSGAGLHV